jgi:hypothetical protein
METNEYVRVIESLKETYPTLRPRNRFDVIIKVEPITNTLTFMSAKDLLFHIFALLLVPGDG